MKLAEAKFFQNEQRRLALITQSCRRKPFNSPRCDETLPAASAGPGFRSTDFPTALVEAVNPGGGSQICAKAAIKRRRNVALRRKL
jgi:hypothetical protein